MTPPLVKIRATSAAEVCGRFAATKEATQLLQDGMQPGEFVAALAGSKKFVDAIDFLAYALPAREAIWWGCLCLQHAVGEQMTPPEKAAAKAAVQWVMNPGETARTAAKEPSDAAPPPSIAGALAKAAFQSGGNVAPPGLPAQAPPPFAPASSVAMAVKLASTKAGAGNILKLQRAFIELGLEIAQGRFL